MTDNQNKKGQYWLKNIKKNEIKKVVPKKNVCS